MPGNRGEMLEYVLYRTLPNNASKRRVSVQRFWPMVAGCLPRWFMEAIVLFMKVDEYGSPKTLRFAILFETPITDKLRYHYGSFHDVSQSVFSGLLIPKIDITTCLYLF